MKARGTGEERVVVKKFELLRGVRPPAPDDGSPPDDWNYGKLWGIMGNYGELWWNYGEFVWNYGKLWGIIG